MNILVWILVLIVPVLVFYRQYLVERCRRIYFGWFIPGPPVYIPILNNGIHFLNSTTGEYYSEQKIVLQHDPEMYRFFYKNDLIAIRIENFESICNWMKKYGSSFRLWLGPDLLVATQDVELIEKILCSSTLLTKTSEYDFLRPWLTDGLLLSTGKKWSKRRKILTPAFHFSMLDNYMEIFDKQTNTLVKSLAKYKNDENIQLERYLTLCALDIIFESTLGTNVNSQEPGSLGYEFATTTKALDASVTRRMWSVVLRNEIFWRFSNEKQIQDKLIEQLHSVTSNIIKDRRKRFLESGTPQIELSQRTDAYGMKEKKSFLDILLQTTVDGKQLSDLEIREEVDTFIFEGHDTTKSGLLFTLYNIAKYPQVQQQCFDKIVRVFGSDKNIPTTITHLNDLRYLELVIKESLRLFPSVPTIGRLMTEDVKLKNELVIPKGTFVGMFLYGLGRCPKLYSDPETFRPERFETTEFENRSSAFQYIPFSAGLRNCIGQKFAMLELKTTISKILRNYEIALSEETVNSNLRITFELILKPTTVMEFNIKERVY